MNYPKNLSRGFGVPISVFQPQHLSSSLNRNENNNGELVYHGGMKRKSPFIGEIRKNWATSEIERETSDFIWTVKTASAFLQAGECIESPNFKDGPAIHNHIWNMKLSSKTIENVDWVSVRLHFIPSGIKTAAGQEEAKVRFQITLLNQNDSTIKFWGGLSNPTLTFTAEKCVWALDKFIKASELNDLVLKQSPTDSFRIHCRIWIDGKWKHNSGLETTNEESSSEDRKLKRLRHLGNDMRSAFQNAKHTDLAVLAGGETFLVHKFVLAARSRVFDVMLTSGMVETAQSSIEILDFESDVVGAMIEYIYTGEIPSLNDKGPDLLQIAEKYELLGLKEDCERAIASNLTIENVADVFVLAHFHNASILQPKVMEFVLKNKDILRTSEAFTQVVQANPAIFVNLFLKS